MRMPLGPARSGKVRQSKGYGMLRVGTPRITQRGGLFGSGDSARGQVFMIFRPAGRFAMGALPPLAFAARFFAAVMRPPLLFLAIMISWVDGCCAKEGIGRRWR